MTYKKTGEFLRINELRSGMYFKREIPYIGSIVARVNNKLKRTGFVHTYSLPVEIVQSTNEECYSPGEVTILEFEYSGKFALVPLMEPVVNEYEHLFFNKEKRKNKQ